MLKPENENCGSLSWSEDGFRGVLRIKSAGNGLKAMLVDFRTENHRSLRDEQGITFEAGSVDGDELRLRSVAGTKLLPLAGVFGGNASGKSNILSAIEFMREAVSHSYRVWPPDGGVPRDPFAWGPKRKEASLYQATFILDGARHEYGFLVNDERVLEEWLVVVGASMRPQKWFEREGDAPIKFGEHLKGENKTVERLTRPNSLFLSTAAQNNHAQLTPVFRWLRNIHAESRREGALRGAWADLQEGALEGTHAQLFREMLRAADVGIVDFKFTSSDGGPPVRGQKGKVQLRHRSSSPDAWLPLEEESAGTQRLFRIGPLVINALATGGVLLIDELDAAFQPLLAIALIRAFHDPRTNKRNAQLLFTTHDTTLLGNVIGEPVLRRDQVWLTEKDEEGATRLFPLTDFKPRKSENLERGYLQGRYGAIPVLGSLASAEK